MFSVLIKTPTVAESAKDSVNTIKSLFHTDNI